MRRKLRAMVAAMPALLLLHPTGLPAQTNYEWTNAGGDNRWDNPANWRVEGQGGGGQGVPGSTGEDDQVSISRSGPDRLVVSSSTLPHARIRAGVTAPAEIEVLPGAFIFSDSTIGNSSIFGQNHNTIVIHRGGTVALGQNNHGVYIGDGMQARAVYNLAGGTLDVMRGSLFIPRAKARSAELNISGGSLSVRFNLMLGEAGTGGARAPGRLSVLGSGASEIDVGTDPGEGGDFIQSPHGILDFAIDPGGVTPISVRSGSSGAGGNVTFERGATLNLRRQSGAPSEGAWTLMRWEGRLDDRGLRLTPEAVSDNWAIAFADIDGDGAPDELRAIRRYWYTEFDIALASARRDGKPVLCYFYNSDVPSSTGFEADVLNTPEFMRLTTDFVHFKEDVVPGEGVAERARIARVPAIVLIDRGGRAVSTLDTDLSYTRLQQAVQSVLE